MKQLSFLELMEGINTYFPEDIHHLCTGALKHLTALNPKLGKMSSVERYDYLEKSCPEFKEWIMRKGRYFYNRKRTGFAYEWGDSWNIHPKERLKVFNKQLNKLRKECTNE